MVSFRNITKAHEKLRSEMSVKIYFIALHALYLEFTQETFKYLNLNFLVINSGLLTKLTLGIKTLWQNIEPKKGNEKKKINFSIISNTWVLEPMVSSEKR